MNYNTPTFPILHDLLEFAQTHVYWVGDAIQASNPLSLPALNLSQHQGLFQWVSSSHQVAKVLELQLQHQSSQLTFRLISFRMDWFNLLAVQGTHKSLLQTLHKSLSGHSFCLFVGFKGSMQFSKDSICAFSGSTEARYKGCGLWGHSDSGVNLSLSLIDSGEMEGASLSLISSSGKLPHL